MWKWEWMVEFAEDARFIPTRRDAIAVGSTRERILDCSIDLFGTKGVDAVSLDEIARHVGVRKQTVLYWFASKDDLVDGVLESVAAQLLVVIDAAVRAASDDPLEKIDAVVRAVFRPAVRRPALLGLVREMNRLGPGSCRSAPRSDRPVDRSRRGIPGQGDGSRSPSSGRPGSRGRPRLRHGHRHRHRARGVARRRLDSRRARPAATP